MGPFSSAVEQSTCNAQTRVQFSKGAPIFKKININLTQNGERFIFMSFINVKYDLYSDPLVASTKFSTILKWKKRDYYWSTTYRGFKLNMGCQCIYDEVKDKAPLHHFNLHIILYIDKDNYIIKELTDVKTKRVPIFLEEAAIKFVDNFIEQMLKKMDK